MPSKSPKRRRAPRLAPRCVFQRLMICHYQLPELCTGGGLDEGASLEELSEHILYYHQDVSTKTNAVNETEEHESYATSDAVQFAGLCSALLSLPNAVVGDESSTDKTREVHLSGSTLVFVPLEEREGIMAIAQLERSSPVSSKDYNLYGNASPLAVQKSIEKCHELFCLLRGGIHYHLSTTCSSEFVTTISEETSATDVQREDNDDSVYPGMPELYSLWKQVRRLRQDMSRSNDATQQNEQAELIVTLDERIQFLKDTLPISALRKQLRTHYDEYIADTGLVSTATGILHRCLVENVPNPIVNTTEALIRDYPPVLPSPVAAKNLETAVQNLLDRTIGRPDSNDPFLVGISLFFNGELIFSKSSSADNVLLVTPRTACLLMEFMASYRRKIAQHAMQHSGLPSIKARSPPRRIGSGLRRFLSGSLVDEDTITTMDPADISISETDEHACYLAPPPLSMLNVSDQVLQVDLPSHGSVWTPQVYLPVAEDSERKETLETNLVLLDVDEYSFLLYLRPGKRDVCNDEAASPQSISLASHAGEEELSNTNEQGPGMASSAIITIPAYSRLLEMIAMDLSNAVTSTRDLEGESVESKQEKPFAESGQHVVFIDRVTQRIVLFSDGEARNNNTKSGKMSKESSSDVSSAGIDCRHVLASNLPPNVVAAFDDLMTQVHASISSSEEGLLQLCTYMPQGWVYAHAQDDKELYIFFNVSKFVTVSDVQHAADRVRIELFNDANR